jgi:hypothetical protein
MKLSLCLSNQTLRHEDVWGSGGEYLFPHLLLPISCHLTILLQLLTSMNNVPNWRVDITEFLLCIFFHYCYYFPLRQIFLLIILLSKQMYCLSFPWSWRRNWWVKTVEKLSALFLWHECLCVITLSCSNLAGGVSTQAVTYLPFVHSWSRKCINIKAVVSPFWCLVRPQAWYSTTQHCVSNCGGGSTTRPSNTNGLPPSVLGCLLFWLEVLWYLHWNTLDILFKHLVCVVNWCLIRKASFTWLLLQ